MFKLSLVIPMNAMKGFPTKTEDEPVNEKTINTRIISHL